MLELEKLEKKVLEKFGIKIKIIKISPYKYKPERNFFDEKAFFYLMKRLLKQGKFYEKNCFEIVEQGWTCWDNIEKKRYGCLRIYENHNQYRNFQIEFYFI